MHAVCTSEFEFAVPDAVFSGTAFKIITDDASQTFLYILSLQGNREDKAKKGKHNVVRASHFGCF